MRNLFLGVAAVALIGARDSRPMHVQMFYPVTNGDPISCATALQSDGKMYEASKWWALGYWSGRNTESSRSKFVGRSTDAKGIIGEIEQLCRDQPSASFMTAVAQAYYNLQMQGR